MRVLITRPAGDGQAFAADLAACGVEAIVAPVMTVRFLDDVDLDLDGLRAVLVTSANGARALARLTGRRDLDLVAVGPATAREAHGLGFSSVMTAGGDVDHLADLVTQTIGPDDGRLIHIAGSIVAGDLQGRLGRAGYTVERVVAYRADPVETLPEPARHALETGSLHGVVFFSARTAVLFDKLVAEAGLRGLMGDLSAFCLSPAVADALDAAGFGQVLVAEQPEGDRLRDLICSRASD